MENGVFKPTTVGTPQGGVFSPPCWPLFINQIFALNSLDWLLDRHGLRSNVTPMTLLSCAATAPKLKKH
uniref:Reverse transcriptase (RNA-dependent DNA polymerase) n=1 Tax=Candidatus Kentrum sp. LPFa TaxID=2126335 RepID=A0A450X9R0_9GAMM|nr:MAG: hypothetical protein BECKLPF1236A_GA0070988_105091 [Candidatus Kentron sp. LPFa]